MSLGPLETLLNHLCGITGRWQRLNDSTCEQPWSLSEGEKKPSLHREVEKAIRFMNSHNAPIQIIRSPPNPLAGSRLVPYSTGRKIDQADYVVLADIRKDSMAGLWTSTQRNV
jgi:hypothetical protein